MIMLKVKLMHWLIKLQAIVKIPATQNIAKNRTDFPMDEQSLSSSRTEAIT